MPSRKPASRQRRRSANQWHAIIQRFETSGLSQSEFCRQENLSPTTFNRWRHRALTSDHQPGFVELLPELSPLPDGDRDWTLELDLPGGVILRIRSPR